MKSINLLFFFFGIAFANECFEYDIDYDGTNLNNGLEQKTSTADDCWQMCKLTVGCEGFTWAASDFPDDDYKNACWLKKNIIDHYPKSKAVSGPRECNPSSPCCHNLEFVAGPDLTSSLQSHILGRYEQVSNGPEGTWHYQQVSGERRKLWYVPTNKAWFIGDAYGSTQGYAVADGTAQCPENMPNTWEWWDFQNVGDWVLDPAAGFNCV